MKQPISPPASQPGLAEEPKVAGKKEALSEKEAAPERIGTFFFGQRGRKLNEFVFEDISVLRGLPLAHGFILGIVLHPGDEIDFLGGPLTKEAVIVIRAVAHDDRSWLKPQLLGDFNFHDLAFGDRGVGRQIAIVIQDEVQFDGPLVLRN